MFLVELDDGKVERLDAHEVRSLRGRIRAFLMDEAKPESLDLDIAADPLDLTLTLQDLFGEDPSS